MKETYVDWEFVSAVAEAIIRTEQSVLRHWKAGLNTVESARELGCSQSTVEKLRRRLKLTTGKAWRRGVEPMGRSRDMTITIEVK